MVVKRDVTQSDGSVFFTLAPIKNIIRKDSLIDFYPLLARDDNYGRSFDQVALLETAPSKNTPSPPRRLLNVDILAVGIFHSHCSVVELTTPCMQNNTGVIHANDHGSAARA